MARARIEKRTFSSFLGAPGLETQIDEPAGIIRGVSVITEGRPVDGRLDPKTSLPIYIDRTTLEQVCATAKEYEGGLKVMANHRSGIFDATGYLKNFRIETGNDGLQRVRADLSVLDSDENKAKLFEMARKIPDTFGLSISCGGEDENRGDRVLLRCEEIYSSDLVTEPAANPTGLFGAEVDAAGRDNPSTESSTTMDPKDILTQCGALVDAAKSEMAQRFAAHDKSLEELKKMMSSVGDGVTGSQTKGGEKPDPDAKTGGEFAALRTQVTQLGADFGTLKKELESMPAKLAKEFSAAVGTTATRTGAADGGAGGGDKGLKPEDRFEKTVQKHFAAVHSKTKAMSLAITEDEDGYQAFMAAGRKNVKFT